MAGHVISKMDILKQLKWMLGLPLLTVITFESIIWVIKKNEVSKEEKYSNIQFWKLYIQNCSYTHTALFQYIHTFKISFNSESEVNMRKY